jgi:hypothetical protein
MKKILLFILSIVFIFLSPAPVNASWDFYFFGVDTKVFKQADYKMVALGMVTSIAVHTAGHYLYASINNMDIHQEGFNEVVGSGYSSTKYRNFAQAGFVLQHSVGLILTSLPATRHLDFTRGYISYSFLSTVSYPLVWSNSGDLHFSDEHNGNKFVDYVFFSSIATHNMLRVKWYTE